MDLTMHHPSEREGTYLGSRVKWGKRNVQEDLDYLRAKVHVWHQPDSNSDLDQGWPRIEAKKDSVDYGGSMMEIDEPDMTLNRGRKRCHDSNQ